MNIVATTIWVPRFLDSYLANFREYGVLDRVKMWVVGDRKTPPELSEYAARMRAEGLDVEYLDPASQQQWLARFPDLATIIPWNSDNRRNVGFLRALEEGCEILVSIDDDNYAIPSSNFYEGHLHTGGTAEVEAVEAESGWYNICRELVLRPDAAVIPRGFPYRHRDASFRFAGKRTMPVAANAGLWLGDPDVDAATRLACPVQAVDSQRRSFALAPGTWSPINTQNTAVARRAIPAYYYVRMLEDLPGARLDRYGDIWSGYFLTRCAEHLGECITVGLPLVQHDRNQHDLLEDLRAEIWGMIATPPIVAALRESVLSGSDYGTAARSLAHSLDRSAESIAEGARLPIADYVRRIAAHLRVWTDVCAELM